MTGLDEFLHTPLGGALVAVVVGVLLLGSAPFWLRPLKAWWWRRAVRRLPDYVRSRSERYVERPGFSISTIGFKSGMNFAGIWARL